MTATGTLLSDRYRLLERIGAGGMATVWRAHDTRLGRDVAVKILRPQFAEDPEFAARFESEARHAASISHPNVATVFDTGVEGDERYIVMELIDGPSVADIIRARGPMPPGQAVDVAASAARALAAAHRRGLIHRDVKPANILVGRDGRVRLADFGIARALTTSRVTMPGTVLGSIPYLSPEQARGEEASATGDVFSLGVVLYEMLTGRLPWAADGPAAMATVRTTEPPVPIREAQPDVPLGLQRIVSRALNLEPAIRYPSARAFAESLEAWARKHASALPPEPDLAETATLVAASPFPGAGGTDDPLVSSVPTGAALAAVALARANPDVRVEAERIEPQPGPPSVADHVPGPGPSAPADPELALGAAPMPPPAPPPPSLEASPRHVARARREATRPRRANRERSDDRRSLAALLAALVPIAAVAVILLGTAFRGPVGGRELEATGTPDLAVVPPVGVSPSPTIVPSPSPSVSASPTATPSPSPEPTPPPEPATPRPTPRPTPAPTAAPPRLSAPARAVADFYDAVEEHDWDRAIARWSPSMQERYPPQEWLIDRFERTTRIDLTRLQTLALDGDAGTARVAVSLTEYRTVEPSPRRFTGAWDLVRIDGRWRLNNPDF